MATTLPRPSLPPCDPPTTALPPLPSSKLRKSLGSSQSRFLPSQVQSPTKRAIRTPSKIIIPSVVANVLATGLPKPQQTVSSPSIPTLRSTSTAKMNPGSPTGERFVRRTISIAAFPQPPRSATRIATLSGRPSLGGASSPSPLASPRRGSGDSSETAASTGSVRAKRPKKSSESLAQKYMLSNTSPSLLNGSGDAVSISAGPGQRGSDGLLSLPSPSQSRSSSAQGSYSTSATTFEDMEDVPRRGREDVRETNTNGKVRPGTKEVKGNVTISVRVRPNGGGEANAEGEWMVDGRKSLVSYRGRETGDYIYDNVFTPHDGNEKVYDGSAKRLVRRVMEGYHGTVFAYGMTGTGKTFSMNGTTQSPGVIPLAITDIFSFIRETPRREFLLRVSYLEIYNEKIRDLLSLAATSDGCGMSGQQEEIKLREDGKRGVYASPLKEEIVQSPTQLLRVIARGDIARKTESTQFNSHSSRSHAVVQIVIESRERALITPSGQEDKRAPMAPGGVRVSTLSLIDLAGSERAADNKDRRTEGAHINKSLLTLGTVIARLSGNKDKTGNSTDKDGKHLPYRDSKLTRLLQPALSGNSLISILCTIQIGSGGSAAVANNHTMETLNTLKFAARARNNIVSHAKKAEEALAGSGDASRGLLERYRMEIQTLRGQLEGQGRLQAEKEEKQLEKDADHRHEEQMLEMQLARTALKERIEHLNRLIICSKSTGVNGGTFTSLGAQPRLTGYASLEFGNKSARSSISRSTLNQAVSHDSSSTAGTQIAPLQSPISTFEHDIDSDSIMGRFADGAATLQEQNRALRADLVSKNRYISTLEKRLDQARRSSHSRSSVGFSPITILHEKTLALQDRETQIAEMRAIIEGKDRKLEALQSAIRTGDGAEAFVLLAPKSTVFKHQTQSSNASSNTTSNNSASLSPIELLSSPSKYVGTRLSFVVESPGRDKNRRSVDEMSRMLDEMIQDRVEKGELVKSERSGSVRVAKEISRRTESFGDIPDVDKLAVNQRQDSEPGIAL